MAYDDIVSEAWSWNWRGTLVMLVLSQLREPAYGYALVIAGRPRHPYRGEHVAR